MRRLTAADVLAVWEAGQSQHPLERALTMLAAALPDVNREQLAALPIGERDRLLARLHAREFGSSLDCCTECPGCGERLEFAATTGDVARPATRAGDGSRFRPPDTNDLMAAAELGDLSMARAELVRRCVMPESSSQPAVDTLLAEMEDAETLANLKCPACSREWQEVLDVAEFVWTRVSHRARQLLWEVHMLASSYGWSEENILSLSPARRRLYLEMLG